MLHLKLESYIFFLIIFHFSAQDYKTRSRNEEKNEMNDENSSTLAVCDVFLVLLIKVDVYVLFHQQKSHYYPIHINMCTNTHAKTY